MKGAVSVTLIPSATTEGMLRHTKSCIVDCTPVFAILHHGTNDASATSSPTETVDRVISLASDTKKNVKVSRHGISSYHSG